MLKQLHQGGHFCWYLTKRFFQDDCLYRASALTFTALLALVPLMTVGLSVFMAFPHFGEWGQRVQNFIFQNFVPASGQALQSYLQGFVAQAHNLSLIGSLFLVVTAVLMLFTIEQTLNHIWRVEKPRRELTAFLLYWALLTLAPILLGGSIALSAAFLSIPWVVDAVNLLHGGRFLLPVIPFLLAMLAFTILYSAIPNCHVPLRYSVVGAAVTSLLFNLSKYGFTAYITHFPSYTLLYGTFAVIPLFLIWLYLIWVIVLFGAELTHALMFRQWRIPAVTLDGFTHACVWLGYFWQAQQEGRALSMDFLVKQQALGYEVPPEKLIRILLEQHVLEKTATGLYSLNRDFNVLTFEELRHLLPWKLPAEVPLASLPTWCEGLKKTIERVQRCVQEEGGMPLSEVYSASLLKLTD
jgi:membrane protein